MYCHSLMPYLVFVKPILWSSCLFWDILASVCASDGKSDNQVHSSYMSYLVAILLLAVIVALLHTLMVGPTKSVSCSGLKVCHSDVRSSMHTGGIMAKYVQPTAIHSNLFWSKILSWSGWDWGGVSLVLCWWVCYAVMSNRRWNSSFRLEPPGLMAMSGFMSGPLSASCFWGTSRVEHGADI